MKKTMKSFNSTLRAESPAHRAKRLAGLLPKKAHKLAPVSKKSASLWAKARRECLERYGHRCFICGRSDLPISIHHWQYCRSQRPDLKYDQDNLIPVCPLHHDHHGPDARFYELQDIIKKIKGDMI